MSAGGRKPTAEQARAAQRRDRDVFLEAGAGTGKTGVLVERYCEAVTADGTSPEQILAFTFTEKAAAELRRRIRAELERRAHAADGADAARLADAVRSLGAAPITTIHGFCRRLLASHPIAAGLDPRFRVLDAAEARRVGWTAFEDALEDFAATAGAEGERLIALLTVRRARQIVLRAHEELVSRGDEPALPPVRPRDLDAALDAIEATAAAMAEAEKGTPSQKRDIAAARGLAAGRGEHPPGVAEIEALEFAADSDVPEVKAAQRAIRTAVAVATEPGEGLAAYDALGRLLVAFAARFTEAKTRRSGLDFEDLQREAVRLLERSSEIGGAYRERFSHLLVDEFQDTNALQLKLIEALRGPETRLFCVGDEFQSIYGFRHADIDIFTAERARFDERAGAETMRLSGNFRSQPQIVAAVNEVGNALLPGFNDLTCGRAGGGDPSPVEMLVTEHSGWADHREALQLREGDRTAGDCLAEARGLAQRLRRLVDEEGRHPGEIVVLLRAFTQVEAFEAALERAGLPVYVVGGGGYWSRQQAQDMVALLSAIANPLDDEALLGALSSPAGGVRPDTLWALRRAIGRKRSIWTAVRAATGRAATELDEPASIKAIPDEERSRLDGLAAVIESLQRVGTRLPLETLLSRAVEETGYDLAILRSDHGRERFANVRKMMRLARDFEAVEGRDLRGFLDYAALSAEQDAEAPAAVESEEGDGVRIMTIHAAKGLEFPVVAVAQLGRAIRGGRDADLVLGRPAEDPLRAGLRLSRLGARTLSLFDYEGLVDEGIDRDEAEELRLAYVAVTRARDRLILSGVRTDTEHSDERAVSVLRRVMHHLGIEKPEAEGQIEIKPASPIPELATEPIAGARIELTVTAAGEEAAARLGARLDPLPALHDEAESPPPLVDRRAPALPARTLSYSTLSEHARCGYRFYIERVLGLGSRDAGGAGDGVPRDRALQIGNAAHELLRRSAESRWAPPSAAAIGAALARHGVGTGDTEARERLAAQVGAWVGSETPAALRGGAVRLHAEHPFLLDVAGTVVRGSIDLLAERPGRPPLVVDYKTDRLDRDDPAERAARYTTQRDVYALAVGEALEVPEVEVSYVFLERPDAPASVILGPDELAAARASLTAAVEAVTEGEFELTPTPDWPLCRDCPARRRLCPSPAPRPDRVAA